MSTTERQTPTPETPTAPFTQPRFRPLVNAFRDLFGRRRDGGGALAVYQHGEPVVDVWAGYADVDAGTPWAPDTMAMSFSTSKGVTSTLVHRLVQKGVLDLDVPVATWWPAFAAEGKEDITLVDILTHRAGLHRIRGVAEAPGDLLDHRRIAALLAARPPGPERGRPAYHAMTFGYLVAGVVEHATGRDFADLLAEEVATPLAADGLYISTPAAEHHRIAPFFQDLSFLGLNMARVGHYLKYARRLRPFVDALLPHGFDEFMNSPALWGAVMPAANGVFTARSLARMYAPLASGGIFEGERYLEADVLERAGKVQTRQRDAVLGMPMRWRLGYHQAFVLGSDQPRLGFGHFGLGGSGAWADPETRMSIAFTTNRLGMATTPLADVRLARLGAVALECARTPVSA
ncbi:serine hydrolase domain-containing protein [Euzebya sp.]|uniref:serine hydrolase domain-containing protein n=1 Tax=Euzebya sp. TaxID=1971409 RepID=UPI003515BEB8